MASAKGVTILTNSRGALAGIAAGALMKVVTQSERYMAVAGIPLNAGTALPIIRSPRPKTPKRRTKGRP